MNRSDDLLLGQIAVKLGFISRQQLDDCVSEQERSQQEGGTVKLIGEIMSQKGLLDTTKMARLVEAQKEALAERHKWLNIRKEDALFGTMLIRFGILRADKVNECLRIQGQMIDRDMGMRLGEILVKKGYLTPAQVTETLLLQDKVIMWCPACARRFNVPGRRRGAKVRCPECKQADLVLKKAAGNVAVHGSAPELPTVPRASSLQEAPTSLVPQASCLPSQLTKDGKPFGRYILLSELGHGGMGIVYKAWDKELQRVVALKMILSQEGEEIDQDTLARFVREARTAAKLRHPGIVQIHDVGSFEGKNFFTMDYLEGNDLAEMMAAARPVLRKERGTGVPPVPAKKEMKFSLRQKLEILHGISIAVGYAHQQGVVHRDLKPANVIVTAEGKPIVTDFGLARNVKGDGKSGLTVSGKVMGTPAYMAPEQALGKVKEIGPPTDVYALGVILYEMLTRAVPFSSDNIFELLRDVAEREPRRPSSTVRNIPEDVETICLKALEKSADRRYANAGEFAEDLGRYLDGEPIAARPTTAIERLWRRAMKRKAVVLPTAAAVLFGIGFLGWLGYTAHERGVKIENALTQAGRFEQAGDVDHARIAYKEALDLDGENSEARNGFRKMDEAVKAAAARKEAEIAEAKSLASSKEAEAQDAEEARRKGLLVQNVLSRFVLLGPVIERIEVTISDQRLTGDVKRTRIDAMWREVKDYLDATPRDPTSQAAAKALAGWARWLAGYTDEGLAWMREASSLDPDLPFGPLMEVLVHFRTYLLLQPTPTSAIPLPPTGEGATRTGQWFGSPGIETREMADLRTRVMAPLLDQIERTGAWGEGDSASFQSALGGIRAIQAGRYGEAVRHFTQAPGSVAMVLFKSELLFARARARFLSKQYAEAACDMERVLQTRPGQAEMHRWLAEVRLFTACEEEEKGADASETLRGVIACCDEALRIKADLGIAYDTRAQARQRLGDTDDAIVDLDKAVALLPLEGAPRANRGLLLLGLGETEKAIQDLKDAVYLAPDSPMAYNARGLGWRAAGHPTDALKDFSRALELLPGDVVYLTNRALTYVALNDLPHAMADAEEAVRRWPSEAMALNTRGRVRLDANDLPGARNDFEAALALSPGYLWPRINRAVVFLKQRDFKHAMEDLDTALLAIPGDPTVLSWRARLWEAQGDLGRAITEYSAAIQAHPQDAKLWNDRGAKHWKRGELDAALSDFDHALDIKPRFAVALVNRAEVFADKRQYDKALADLDAAIGINRDLGDAYGSRARIHRLMEQFDLALADYEEALKRKPEWADAWAGRGLARQGKKDYDGAIADLQHALDLAPADWPNRARAQNDLQDLRALRDRLKQEIEKAGKGK